MPTGTGLPLCRKYICRGGSCQEQRGIMFLMAIPGGSVLPEWWLSNSGLLAQTSPEYSFLGFNYNTKNCKININYIRSDIFLLTLCFISDILYIGSERKEAIIDAQSV